jgi:hypothetical protein
MARLIKLADYRRNARARVTFNRQELRQLLDVYSRRVASGEWKDYAIDHGGPAAVFSVFRHSFDVPAFAIAKRSNGRNCDYLVMSGRREIKHGASIGEVLSVFEQPLRLLS